jgi:5-methylcytosine-specific restriction protein A
MKKRREFSKAIKVAVVKRTTRDGVTYCEKCGAIAKRWQIDHVIADALGGEPILSNAELICEPCYSIKNPQDTKLAAKVKRQEARALGIRKEPTLKSAPRQKAPPQNNASRPMAKTSLPPRPMYRSEI